MIALPTQISDPNVRALAQHYVESFTGVTGPSVTLSYQPAATVDGIGLELVFKNGVLLSSAAGGSSSAARETFTSFTGPTITLGHHPVMDGLEAVFKNGQLLDGHIAQDVPVTSLHTTLNSLSVTVGSVSVSVSASGTDSAGDTVTVTGSGSGTGTGTIDNGVATGTGTLEVEPARGSYTIDGPTGVITLDQDAIASDIFTVFYNYGIGSTGSAGYTIDGNLLTFATDLVSTDAVVVVYPYRA